MPVPTPKKNYYEVLDLDKDASEEAIKVAYRKLALKWHPDRHQDDKEDAKQKFIEINDAYTALLESIHKSRRRKRDDEKSRTSTYRSSSTTTSSSSSSSSRPSESRSSNSRRSGTSDPTTKASQERKESDRRAEGRSSRGSDPDRPAKSEPSKAPSRRPKTPHAERVREFPDTRSDSDYSSSDEEDKRSAHGHRKHGSHSNHSKKSRHVEGDGYEFVNLSSPLNPLRSPKSGGSMVEDWIFPLKASLEDLYHGANHHYRITRTLQSGKTQNVKIDIKVAAGWKTGTRIRVPGVGNEREDGSFQDIVFVVEEEEHPRFKRAGDDVYVTIQIPWANSLTRPYTCSSMDSRLDDGDDMAFVKGLDGEEYALPIPRSLVEAADGTRVVGAGMPIRHRGERAGKGDLVIKWDFIFLDSDKVSRSRWQSLKKAMHWRI